MAVTLAEAKNNAQTDYDPAVIDEFRKESTILDSLIFDDVVNPAGGGATLTYGYRRLATQPTAATRALNTEYTSTNVTTVPKTVDLAVMGGAFDVDRVIAKIGPALSGAVQLNLQQKIKATRTKFQDLVVNGDIGIDANGFDGLNKALTGSSTEINRGSTAIDWSGLTSVDDSAFAALDKIDEFLSVLDGAPTIVVGNAQALARVRAAVRRSGMYLVNPVDGLVGANGRPITRETYGGVTFADPGDKDGTSSPIIPTVSKNTKWTVTVTGASGGTFALVIDGVSTGDIAYNVAAADLQTLLRAMDGADPALTVSLNTGVYSIDFKTNAVFATIDTSKTEGTAPVLATNGGTALANVTDLYAYRVALDGFHGVSTVGGQLVQTWLPQFDTPGAVKKGEVELGPVAVALKATKAAAVLRNVKVK